MTKTLPKTNIQAYAWDQLWESSSTSLPTLRRDCLAAFVNRFCDNSSRFTPLTVDRDGKLVAALPLVATKFKGLRSFQLPHNPWMTCGDLLVNSAVATPDTFDELAGQIRSLPALLLSLEWVKETDDWRHLIASLKTRNCRVLRSAQLQVGAVNVDQDWESYWRTLSKNHRKGIKKNLRKLEKIGPIQFHRLSNLSPKDLLTELNSAFAIEHAGWKGKQNSSVLSVPGTFEFYLEVARSLCGANAFELQFLTVDGKKIAFEYGYVAQKTYYSHKVGYAPQYAGIGPGQLLMYLQLQSFFESAEINRVDTMGILSRATARWCNDFSTRYKYLISTGGIAGNSIVSTFGLLKSKLCRDQQPMGQEHVQEIMARRS